jgi:glutathione S-transferase
MNIELFGLPYSPWTIKARWALDHHRVRYRWREHMPLLGEPFLRARSGRATGKVTVPLLRADEDVLMDSFDIARWAEAHGSSASIFPSAQKDSIKEWNDRSEALLDATRALSLPKIIRSRKAQIESVPVPAPLDRLFYPVAGLATRFLANKYGAREDRERIYQDRIRTELGALRAALKGDYLLGELSYADIAMAVGLSFVKPPGPKHDALAGDATRECLTVTEAATEFADLLAWRDRIYSKRPSQA